MINELENNILLFAGAGTGKTFTVANRVANVLAQGKATAGEILCLTFTIKACNEMKEDILGYAGEVASATQTNTIHGFCYKVVTEERKRLRAAGEWNICDEVDQDEIIKKILSTRFYAWRLDENCKREGLETPDVTKLPVCFVDEEYYWIFGDRLIDGKGEFIPMPDEIMPVEQTDEAFLSFAKKEFSVYKKKSGLRNLISEIKHVREAEKLYTEDDARDNQRAFDWMKENKPTVYEGLTSYYATYLGYTSDEEYVRALDEFAGRLTAEYDEYLRVSNLLDFDDLIIQANRILDAEEGCEYWSNRYKYIILDEMQDTSRLEYEVLKKIFAKNNVMLCGDFFQTIYAWRGSCPEEILEEFTKEFQPKRFTFSENYRATKTLAEATFGYLKNTYPQLLGKYSPKNLDVHSQSEGDKILCYAFDNREEEAAQIYRYLLKNKPKNPMDVCIIARSNKYIAELSKYFQQIEAERGEKDCLRFFTVEENFQFFKKPVVKDILAVLKLLVNPLDGASMERLTEKYVRQVGIRTIETLRGYSALGVSILSFIDDETYLFGDCYHRLIEGYNEENIVVYDTETTGLDLEKDEIVQLSAIKIGKDGNILDTLDLLIEPTIAIDEGAKKTHGFDLEYIRESGGLTAKDALTKFSAFVKGAVLVGHNNLAYDCPLVKRQLAENGLPPLEIVAEYDTLILAKRFYPQFKNYKLSTLCEHFSVVNACAHNALGDITATGECLMQMLRENILSTALERREILAKYAWKFEKFYAFITEMKTRLQNGEELAEYVVDRLLLRKRYPTRSDLLAASDMIKSLQTEERVSVAFLKDYLRDAALAGSQMDVLIKKLNRIPIITAHQAKGCEFDTVILVGADDGNFPSFGAKKSGNEEEEKKIFYVAITRAKRKLILTRARYNGGHTLSETPYFWKLPEEYVRVNRAWKNGE